MTSKNRKIIPPPKASQKNTLLTPTESILESISDGVFTVDLKERITSFNRAAELITGVDRREAAGRLCSEVFRSSMCGSDCALRQTMKSGKPIIGKSAYIINADGDRIPISVSTAVLKDAEGEVIGGAETFRDLSEVEALRSELHDRFRMGDMASRSPLMQKVFEVLPVIAASPSTVLILGETGTGKELTARKMDRNREIGTHSTHELIDLQAIESALACNHNNRTAAARDLGIHKTTLFRRIKKLGIALPPRNRRSSTQKNK